MGSDRAATGITVSTAQAGRARFGPKDYICSQHHMAASHGNSNSKAAPDKDPRIWVPIRILKVLTQKQAFCKQKVIIQNTAYFWQKKEAYETTPTLTASILAWAPGITPFTAT